MIRRRQRQRAELVEDIAIAYAGCKSKEGQQNLQARIAELMRE